MLKESGGTSTYSAYGAIENNNPSERTSVCSAEVHGYLEKQNDGKHPCGAKRRPSSELMRVRTPETETLPKGGLPDT